MKMKEEFCEWTPVGRGEYWQLINMLVILWLSQFSLAEMPP